MFSPVPIVSRLFAPSVRWNGEAALPDPGGRSGAPGKLLRFGCCSVLALLFTLVVVHHHQQFGRLQVPPMYDDVTYLNDGWHRWHTLTTDGPMSLLADLVKDPPHSPYSSAMAALSYVLLGFDQSSPYDLSGAVVLALLLLVDARLGSAPLWQRLATFLFVLTFPYTAWVPGEFRPDLACGIVTAAGLTHMLRGSWLDSPWKHRTTAGICCGLALFIKPTVFLLTLTLFAATLVVVVLRDCFAQRVRVGWRSLAVSLLPALGAVAVIAGPYYLVGGVRIWRYFYDNAIGSQLQVWEMRASFQDHFWFYLTGAGGSAMFGRLFSGMFGLMLLIAAATVAVRKTAGLLLVVPFAAVGFLTWFLPTLHAEKTCFFGATFGFFFLFTFLEALVVLLRGHPVGGSRIPAAALGVLCIVLSCWWWHFPRTDPRPGTARVTDCNRVLPAVYQAVKACRKPACNIFLTATGYLNRDVLEYLALQDGVFDLQFSSSPFSRELTDYREKMTRADVVVAGEAGNGLTNENFASGPLQEQTLSMVRDDPDFVEAAALATSNGKRFFVFRRK